jgi:hypothetical protein
VLVGAWGNAVRPSRRSSWCSSRRWLRASILCHHSRTLRYASRWLTSSVGLWNVAIRSL